MPAAVFINYRRDDTKGFAGALLRELNERIGADQVFMDFEDIPAGADFPAVLREAVSSASVVLALIGPRWLDMKDASGRPRLEGPTDYVRLELELALGNEGARVIPVLVDGARLPTAEQLPPSLRALATRNALELSNGRWDEDVARLADQVREGLYAMGLAGAGSAALAADFDALPKMTRATRLLILLAFGFGLVFAGVGAAWYLAGQGFERQALRAEGEVVELRRESASSGGGTVARPVVRFTTAQGQAVSIASQVASDPPAYRLGERVGVLYHPNEPTGAVIDSFWQRHLGPVLFLGIGAIALLCAAVPLVLRARARRRLARLLREGRPVLAGFHAVEQVRSVTVNDRHPFVVLAEWRNPVSQEPVLFRSPWVWDDPTEQARRRMITVVVDPNNFRHYLMDLSFLKRKDGGRPAAKVL